MFKKTLIILSVLLLITSCSWNEQITTESKSLTSYKWTDFSLDIPISWVVINNSWSTLPTPKDWKLELAVSAKEEKDGFVNNMIILSKDLEGKTKSYDFMLKNNPKNYKWYDNYLELEAKDFEFADGEKSKLYVFEAKYNKDNTRLKFMQTAKVCDEKKSFFLTIGLSLNINDTAKYEDILKSFECN